MAFIRSSENLTGTHIPGDSVDASREVFESIMTLRRRNVKKKQRVRDDETCCEKRFADDERSSCIEDLPSMTSQAKQPSYGKVDGSGNEILI